MVLGLYAELLTDLGVLETGTLVETDPIGLVDGFTGQTALKTKERVREALGGLLFIDEAYTFVPRAGGRSDAHGLEVIDTLMKEMEDKRDRRPEGEPALLQYFDGARTKPDLGNACTLPERVRGARAHRLGPSVGQGGADLTLFRWDDIETASCKAA